MVYRNSINARMGRVLYYIVRSILWNKKKKIHIYYTRMIVSTCMCRYFVRSNTPNLTTKNSSRSCIIIIYLLYVLCHTQSNLVVF